MAQIKLPDLASPRFKANPYWRRSVLFRSLAELPVDW